jgi:hypothetical protein
MIGMNKRGRGPFVQRLMSASINRHIALKDSKIGHTWMMSIGATVGCAQALSMRLGGLIKVVATTINKIMLA